MRYVLRIATGAALAAVFIFMSAVPAAAQPARKGLEIGTVPATPNFPVTVDGVTALTDKSGVAHFATNDIRSLPNRVKLHNRFMRLEGNDVRVVGSRLYGQRIAISVYWPIRFSYVDVNGAAVDVDKIDAVRLKSSTGEVLRVPADKPVWLQGSRIVGLNGDLVNKKLFWTVQTVEYAGSNVVNSSQQRFQPADTQAVQLELLFYRTEVKVRDALFGFALGRSVQLTYPDQSVVNFPLNESAEVTLPSLPRGNYSIVVAGPGPAMTRPVAVSRDQVLDLKFYSWLDTFVAIAFGLLFAGGTLWVGWTRRRRHARTTRMGLVQVAQRPGVTRPQTPTPNSWATPEPAASLASDVSPTEVTP